MNVEISPELERFVQDQIQTGRYGSTAELFDAGLKYLMLEDELDDEDIEALEEAERQIAAGETISLAEVCREFVELGLIPGKDPRSNVLSAGRRPLRYSEEPGIFAIRPGSSEYLRDRRHGNQKSDYTNSPSGTSTSLSRS